MVPVGLSGEVTLESLFSHFVDRGQTCHLVTLESLCQFKRNRVFSHFGVTFNYLAYMALCLGIPILNLCIKGDTVEFHFQTDGGL